MAKRKRIERDIPLDRIFLHHENPRHEPYATQSQVIEYLCDHEEVPQLARDISQHGLSPLDRFAVVVDHDTQDNDTTYIVAEGNRRVCALMLLSDPDLAPPERKSFFENLSDSWNPISELPCVIFDDHDDLDLWLKRRHHGPANGIGQKSWNADQKARHSGSNSRNRVALDFLDYAEQESLISPEDRKNRLTTVQRYLGNPVMRETLGLETSDPDNIKRNRTSDDFKILSRQFINDMLDGNKDVNSRQNKDSIESYARSLSALPGQNHKRVEAEPIIPPTPPPKGKRRSKPRKASRPQRLPWETQISDSLKLLGNWKLESLYHSICDISLQENAPLLAVGVWSFFETLTARAGRNPQNDFHSFLNINRLTGYGLGTKQQVKPLRDALQRIQNFGNTTKHHDTAASFNGDQLFNDMESLRGVILKLVEDAVSQKSS